MSLLCACGGFCEGECRNKNLYKESGKICSSAYDSCQQIRYDVIIEKPKVLKRLQKLNRRKNQ